MPSVDIKPPESTASATVETILGFASVPMTESDVARFQQLWAGLEGEIPNSLLRLQQPIDQLLGFRSLPPDWDSYGSRPIDDRAIASGLVLLIQADLEKAHAPHICPVPGGGVQLEWQVGQRALELEALPKGSVEFLRIDGDAMVEGSLDPRDRSQVATLIRWLFAER
jgi:hypothetical protein